MSSFTKSWIWFGLVMVLPCMSGNPLEIITMALILGMPIGLMIYSLEESSKH